MVEAYRSMKIGATERVGADAQAPAVSLSQTAPVSTGPALTPLQDALTKLANFIATGNSGRSFTSRELFGNLDRNKDGTISLGEFLSFIEHSKIDVSQK
jgi:hypothetical protein